MPVTPLLHLHPKKCKGTATHFILTTFKNAVLKLIHQIQNAVVSRFLDCKERVDIEIEEESVAGPKAGINLGRARIHNNRQRYGKGKGNVWNWRKGGRKVDMGANYRNRGKTRQR